MTDFEGILARIGFHAVYEKNIQEAVDLASRHNFSSVQIDATMPQFFPEKYELIDRRNIRRYAEKRGIILKVHVPSEDCSLQTLHSIVQSAVIDRFKEVIDFGYELGGKIVTIHAGNVPVFTIPFIGHVPIDTDYPELHIESLRTALNELSEYAEGRILLCVENSPFTAVVMQVLPSFLEKGKLFLTWDLAKMYRSDGTIMTDVENFFLCHLDKVRECHLHDRTSEYGHQIIGQGYVNFEHYLSLLSEYPVEYTIEVRPVENAVKSFEVLRKILAKGC
jgi:sugar phosphate isomerase/epimerase